MKDFINRQKGELRSIRTNINILFGFIALLISIMISKETQTNFIFSFGLYISFLFICLAFIYSTLGLEKDKNKNNQTLRRMNNLVRSSVIILFLSFTILMMNYWGFKI